jgi:hypothetical protein
MKASAVLTLGSTKFFSTWAHNLRAMGRTKNGIGCVGMVMKTSFMSRDLLAEKEPSLQFTTPDEPGELAVFFCSDAGKNIRGVAWNMDGGWVAQ